MPTEPASPRSDRPPYSRVGSAAAWEEAAAAIARGERLKDVAARLGCSRSTLWRTLQRSERLRTRIEEERQYLSEEAARRFRSLHGKAVDAIESALYRGNLRAAFWVADRLGIAKPEPVDARAGLPTAEFAAEAGRGPAVEMEPFTLDAPLRLEPDVAAELNAAATVAKRAPATPPPTAPRSPANPPKASATPPQKRCRTLHGAASPALTERLKKMPRTAAAWPAHLLPPVPSLSAGGKDGIGRLAAVGAAR